MDNDENKVEETEKPNLRAALASLPTFDDGQGLAKQPSDESPASDETSQAEDAEQSSLPAVDQSDATGQDETNDILNDPLATVQETPASEAESIETIFSEPAAPASASSYVKEVGKAPRRWPFVVGGIACAVALAYGGGAYYFSNHFLPSTTVNGKDVSLMAVSDLAASVTRLGTSYQTHLTGDGLDLVVPGADVGVRYDGDAYARKAAEQYSAWSWPLELMGNHVYAVDEGITFDDAKLAEVVGVAVDQFNATAMPPTNATVVFAADQKRYTMVPDALGTTINRDAVIAAATDGVANLQEEITVGESELLEPAIKADDERLTSALEKANKLLDNLLSMHLQGDATETLTVDQVGAWVQVNPEDGSFIVNRDAIVTWGRDDLSKRYDTVGITRTYKRADGKDVQVSGGSYGWCVDSEVLADQICDRLLAGSSDMLEVPMKSTAAQPVIGGADWPARYIDVDLSEQHMRVYGDDGQVVMESDVVSGGPSHSTDQGVYTIFEHTAGTTLIGPDYDGDKQPDYRTWVNYWMPFNGGMGLHDAYWRGSFGGNIYQHDGSHGCVNLPSNVAKQLFDWCRVGDVVVVHY